MWILVAECLAVFSAAAWPEKGGVDPVGRRAGHARAPDKGTKRHKVQVSGCW
jgi:hypothetical protein